jgi:hypothetical protein
MTKNKGINKGTQKPTPSPSGGTPVTKGDKKRLS